MITWKIQKLKNVLFVKKIISSGGSIHVDALNKQSCLYYYVGTLPQPENEYVSFKWVCFVPCYGQYSLDVDIKKQNKYEELEVIKKDIDNNEEIDDNFKQFLYQLINERQEQLNQVFLQKIILGVSIPAVFSIIFILVSWWKQFKWWVKLMSWWNKSPLDWVIEKGEEEDN